MAAKNKPAKKSINIRTADISELTTYFNFFPNSLFQIVDLRRITNDDYDNIKQFEVYHEIYFKALRGGITEDYLKSIKESLWPELFKDIEKHGGLTQNMINALKNASKDFYPDLFDKFKDKLDKDLYILYIYKYYLDQKEFGELDESDILIEKEIVQIRDYLSRVEVLLGVDVGDPEIKEQIMDISPDERYAFHIKTSWDYEGINNKKGKASRDSQRIKNREVYTKLSESRITDIMLETIIPVDLYQICRYPILSSMINSKVYRTDNLMEGQDQKNAENSYDSQLFKKILASNIEFMDLDRMLMITVERIYASILNAGNNPKNVVDALLEDFIIIKSYISKHSQSIESPYLELDPDTQLPILRENIDDSNPPKQIITIDQLIEGMKQLSNRYINGELMSVDDVRTIREKLLSGERAYDTITMPTYRDALKFSKEELFRIASHNVEALDDFIFCGLITAEDIELLQSPANLMQLFLKRNHSKEDATKFELYFKLFNTLCLTSKSIDEKNHVGNEILTSNTELHSAENLKELFELGLITSENYVETGGVSLLIELFKKKDESPEAKNDFDTYSQLFKTYNIKDKPDEEKDEVGMSILFELPELHSAENLKELFELGLITLKNYVETGGVSLLIELFKKKDESPEAKNDFDTYSQLFKTYNIKDKTDEEKDEVGMLILFEHPELHSAKNLKVLLEAGLITASNYVDFGEQTLLIQLYKNKENSSESAAEFARYCELYKEHYIIGRTIEEQNHIGSSILQNNPEFNNIENLKGLYDLGLITSNNYAQYGGIKHLIDLFHSRKNSNNHSKEFQAYSKEFYELCIENKSEEEKDAIGELIIGQDAELLENRNVKLLQRLKLVTSRTYIEYVGANAIIDLLKSDSELQPSIIRELFNQGILRMDDLIEVMKSKKIPSNTKLTFAYSVFSNVGEGERDEEANDEEKRNTLISIITKRVKDTTTYGDNPGGTRKRHNNPEPEQGHKRIYDPAEKFNLLKQLDNTYTYELSQNGYLILHLPRLHKYIIEKLYDPQSNNDEPRYAYGAATYVLDDTLYQDLDIYNGIISEVRAEEIIDEEEEIDEFDRLLEGEIVADNPPRIEKVVNLSTLRQLNRKQLIRRFYHRRWAERICEEFGVHEEGRYTQEQIALIERLARRVEETTRIR